MQQADYKYRLTEHTGTVILLIEDLDLGNKSLTNDIERVCDHIHKEENLGANQVLVIYKDSDGNWDGWDQINRSFVSLGGTDQWPIAAERYKNVYLFGNINGKP